MKRRVFLYLVLLATAAVLATSILVTTASHRVFQDSMRREVSAEASYLVTGVAQYGMDYLARIDLQRGHRITLIEPDGRVTFDSHSAPEGMDNHAGRPEVQMALATGKGEDTRSSTTLREDTYYVALKMDDGSIFRLSSARGSLLAAYDSIFTLVALIVIVGCLAASIIARQLSRLLIRPLNSIDLDAPEEHTAYEEIAPLLSRIKHQRNQLSLQSLELDRQRAQFDVITQNMNEGLVVLDADGMVLSCNKSGQRLLGATGHSPLGQHILSLNRSQPFRDAVGRASDGESVAEILELNGRYCQLFASSVHEGEARLGLIVIFMDVTERQEREKLRREFTANVSHELKTPLTSISGYAELMMNHMARPDDIPEFSKSIYQESQRLIALVRDLMFLSRLEEGGSPPHEQVDLFRVAEHTVMALAGKANSLDISVSLSGKATIVSGIPSILQEMLYNLLDNAIKYNRPGGSVDISISHEGQSVVLQVADTGIGIPKGEQARIFERFYRVDKSHSQTIEGTGLGLAIVKHAAALHGAELSLHSTTEGSRFSLLFPL